MSDLVQFKPFQRGIWTAESEIQMPLMKFPVRTTAVEVVPGKLVLISPLSSKKCDYQSLRAHGEVVAIVAPNLFHHLFISHAQREFPKAALWGTAGFEMKRPGLKWNFILGRDAWPYDKLKPLNIEGMPKINEWVFYASEAKTLIVTDAFFNCQNLRGLAAWLVLGFMGTYRRFNISRLFFMTMKDKRRAKATFAKILDWDFDSLIVAHGDCLMAGARQKVEETFKRHRIS